MPPEIDPSEIRQNPSPRGRFTFGFRMFALTLAALLVAFYFPFLIGSRAFYQSDLTYYFEPFSRYIADGYREGKFALWNPFLYCGMAQAAVPSPGIFYPPMMLFMAGKFSQSLAVYLIAHQLLAGCGSYLLVASLGWGVLAASVCGLTVAMTGYMFALQVNYTLIATIAWLPLLLFFVRNIDRSWDRRNLLKMFGGSVCMYGMIAAGRPETFFPATLLVVAYIIATAIGAYREDRMARAAAMQAAFRCLSLTGGILFALPVILPAMEWVRLSPRSRGLELQWVLLWSANWYDILGMVVAQPLGDLTVLGSRFLNLVASRPDSLPYVQSSYVGPVVVTLAIWSLFDRNWRWRWVVVAIFVAGLLMAVGQYTPIAPWVCNLTPLFSSFRYPVKLMIFPVLAIAFMAARGANVAIDKEVKPSTQIFTAVLWSLLIVVGAVFILTPQLHLLTAKFPWFAGKIVNFGVMREAQVLFGKSLAVTGALGLLVNANYFAYQREQFTKGIFAFLTGGTLILTLLLPSFAYLRHGTAGDFYERQHPLASRLRELTRGSEQQLFDARVQPMYHDPLTLTHDFLRREKLSFQQGFYLFTRELMLPNTNVDARVPYAFGYEAAEEGFYKQLYMAAIHTSSQNLTGPKNVPTSDVPTSDVPTSDVPIARFYEMTSVRYAVTQRVFGDPSKPVPKLDPALFELKEESATSNYRIYELRRHLPRAYWARSIEWNAERDAFQEVILNTKTSDGLTRDYVQGAPVAGIADGAGGNIQFREETAERAVLAASTDKPRVLVFTDRLYPGWSARIDGQPAEMRLVNFFARGVLIPAGQHTIDFVYSPLSVWGALAIAGITMLAFLVAFAMTLSRRMKRRP